MVGILMYVCFLLHVVSFELVVFELLGYHDYYLEFSNNYNDNRGGNASYIF